MAVCIALIGKENAPKYIACLDYDKELDFHYKVHTSLDIIEEKLNSSVKTVADTRELYLGLLYATEEHKIFGYVTNTRIKIVIVIDANHSSLRDNEIRAVSIVFLYVQPTNLFIVMFWLMVKRNYRNIMRTIAAKKLFFLIAAILLTISETIKKSGQRSKTSPLSSGQPSIPSEAWKVAPLNTF